jgi:succinate dehydrogenase/fumarate reductase flavoprotein subunit
MWEKVGLVRNGPDLRAALAELKTICERAERQSANPEVAFNLEWNESLDVTNICLNAELVAQGALLREESRGSHYRKDFPRPNPEWLKRIRLQQQDGAMHVSYIPINFNRMAPPELEQAAPTALSRT